MNQYQALDQVAILPYDCDSVAHSDLEEHSLKHTSLPMILLAGAISMNAAGPEVTLVNIPNSGMELIPSSSPQFTDVMANYFGLDALSALDPILPYCLIAKNASSSDIAGIGSTIDRKDATGAVTRASQGYFSLVGASMRPGDMLLLAPMHGVSIPIRNDVHTPSLRDRTQLSEAANRFGNRFQGSTEILFTLDSIVFNDGSTLGPDTSGMMDQENHARSRKRSMAQALRKLPFNERATYLQKVIDAFNASGRVLSQSEQDQLNTAEMFMGMVRITPTEESFQASMDRMINVQTIPLHRRNP